MRPVEAISVLKYDIYGTILMTWRAYRSDQTEMWSLLTSSVHIVVYRTAYIPVCISSLGLGSQYSVVLLSRGWCCSPTMRVRTLASVVHSFLNGESYTLAILFLELCFYSYFGLYINIIIKHKDRGCRLYSYSNPCLFAMFIMFINDMTIIWISQNLFCLNYLLIFH